MFHVYAISSEVRDYIYIGLTSDLNKRISEHNSGKNKTTRPYRPFTLIHSESFSTRDEARTREIQLKTGSGREYLKRIKTQSS
jgi:putative endonuclease